MIGGLIFARTTSPPDVVSLLIVELERQFMHMHPAIQWVFLEFSNIHDPYAKHLATILLVHEFGHNMREAREIFAYYRINSECPSIEEILYDQEEIQKLKSTDYAACNENLRKKVSPTILIDKISKHNDQFVKKILD